MLVIDVVTGVDEADFAITEYFEMMLAGMFQHTRRLPSQCYQDNKVTTWQCSPDNVTFSLEEIRALLLVALRNALPFDVTSKPNFAVIVSFAPSSNKI